MADPIDFAAITKEDAAANPPPPGEETKTGAETEATGETVAPPGEEPPAPETPPAKPAGIPVERFKSETAKRREAERRAQTLEETLVKVLNGQRPTSQAPASDGFPQQPQDFPTYEAYLDARADWRVEQRLSVVAKQTQAHTEEQAGKALWTDLRKEAKEKGVEGLEEAHQSIVAGEVATTPAMSRYVEKVAKNKAALVVWLAKNPEEAERIAGLDAVEAGAEMASRDALLGRSKAVTKAPAPPPTVTGGGVAPQTIERMSHGDIMKWAREQQKR